MREVWSIYEESAVMEMLAYSFISSKETINKKIADFVEENGVDEIMATTHVYDHEAKLKSFRLFAEALKLA